MTPAPRTADFDYALPPDLIADRPPERRDASRMMIVSRAAGEITHARFADFPEHPASRALCVFNNTRVIPARFFSEDGRIELLRLDAPSPDTWFCLVKPGRKMRAGAAVRVAGHSGIVESTRDSDGARLIRWENGAPDPEQHGRLALPHYMGREEESADRERYQTVYAARPGAIAAPTAGLHFTDQIISRLNHTFVTLHVGIGTFRPVQAESVADHIMHEEHFDVSPEAAAEINNAPTVLAVGTTVVRVLEHLATVNDGTIPPGPGSTDIFIHPPYQYRRVDALFTNFHLPKSTLLMLVSAFAGTDLMLEAYRRAIEEKYRFFSYGDCMLIV